jgi:hypothetical protein
VKARGTCGSRERNIKISASSSEVSFPHFILKSTHTNAALILTCVEGLLLEFLDYKNISQLGPFVVCA